jgi:anti-sigma B factor antagonist
MDIDISVTADAEGRTIVCPTGDLDIATVGRLAAALSRCADGSEVIVDLTGVTFMDSTTLSVLVEARRRCELSVVGAHGIAQRVLEVSGLEAMLQQ